MGLDEGADVLMEKPLVSVRLVTYNQEKYIAQAIESVLNQKVTFHYELLIGEDASTDTTAAIVDSYQRKYPNIIKVFHRQRNLGRKMNCRLLMQACRGKYVAVLEGDNYWNYEMKLQTQVDYLEMNTNVVATAHNVENIDKDGKKVAEEYVDFPMQKQHIYNKWNVMQFELIGQSSSYVYRNIKYILKKEQWELFLKSNLNGDLKLSYTLGMLGRVVYFDEVWACRRMLFEGSGWTATTYQHNLHFLLLKYDLAAYRYIKQIFGVDMDIAKRISLRVRWANDLAKRQPTKENIVVAVKVYLLYLKFLVKKKIF